ncbi:MAG: methylmalonyl Co-A mutase-associated GTPase MeaB [Planctomycetota bacterium]
MAAARAFPPIEELEAGLVAGDRGLLSRAITLIESSRAEHQTLAEELLRRLQPRTGNAWRVGVSGVPGVGKSTFIDVLGTRLTERGSRVAVLAVDPSSTVTGGSVLGDKTRMDRLSRDPHAFVRPTPGGDATGGVALRSRETMLLCEAAGFDVVLVETIGVGQAEVAVSHLVDTFVLLALAGAGDELQGIKRGIMELADVLVIHKADGDNAAAAERAGAESASALRFLHHGRDGWQPPVLTASAHEATGIDDVWDAVRRHRAALGSTGLAERRCEQALHWFEAAWQDLLRREFLLNDDVAARLPVLRDRVRRGERQPAAAARDLLARGKDPHPPSA